MQYDIPTIIQGYAQGFFLMANDGEDSLGWYSSRQRALMPLDERFTYPKSLRRQINQNRFEVAVNRDFGAVVEGCADRETTWISGELKQIYWGLYEARRLTASRLGAGTTAGGILGLSIGGAFIGESMFFRIPEGSKVAMVKLVERLRDRILSTIRCSNEQSAPRKIWSLYCEGETI